MEKKSWTYEFIVTEKRGKRQYKIIFGQVSDAKQEVTNLWSFTQVALAISTEKMWTLENVFLSLC